MAARRPTICCSALALSIACGTLLNANADPPQVASIFPARVIWTIPLNSNLTADPAYSAARAFFPIDGERLVAYDLVTGRQLWMVPAPIFSKPAVGNDLVFATEGAAIVARDQSTGAVRWTVPLADPLAARLTWDNGWLVAGAVSGAIFAFRASDGELIWSSQQSAPLHAPAALAADRVYLPLADGHIVALMAATGAPLWSRRLGDAPNEILALDDRLYVGSNDKYLYCLDADGDERPVWRWPTGGDVIGQPLLLDGRVHFVSLDNILYAHDANSGSQQWRVSLPIRPTRGVIAAGDALLASGIGPAVHAYRLRDGQSAGELELRQAIAAAPAFVSDATLPMPLVVVVSQEIGKGATVTAFSRSLEPPMLTIAAAAALIAKIPGAAPIKP